MEKAKIRPVKTLNRSSPQLLCPDGTRYTKFCSDRFRGFCATNTWFCRAFGVSCCFARFGVLHRWTDFYAKFVKGPSSEQGSA